MDLDHNATSRTRLGKLPQSLQKMVTSPMKMIVSFFLLTSLIGSSQSIAQQQSERMVVTYESEKGTCQIATFRGNDISQACNGTVIFSPEMNALLVGVGEKSIPKFLAFKGEFTKKFYSFQNETDYPL